MEKFSNIIFTEPRFNERPSAWIEHIPFAFFLIEKLRPNVLVELGTQYGSSYFAFCQAIDELKYPAKAFGVDIWMPNSAEENNGRKIFEYASRINYHHYSHFSNLLMMTFDEALGYFTAGEIDLLHIDGMHDYASVKHDFETWLPKMSDAGVILLHDTNVRENNFGVWRLMDELKIDYPTFNFTFGKGLGVVCTGKKVKEEFLQFVKGAQTDKFAYQLFNALGTRWLLKNHIELFKIKTDGTIAHLKNRIKHLENQLAIKENNTHRVNIIQDTLSSSDAPSFKNELPFRQRQRNKFGVWLDLWRIRKSGFFNADYYLINNPDIKNTGSDPATHYLLNGGFEGRNPSEKFNSAFYIKQYPDVKASGMNPLVHYLRFGIAEGRQIGLK